MQRDILKYLHDIKESIDSIYEYLGDTRDFNDYRSNKLLRRGIERELEIIGEATGRILKIDKNIAKAAIIFGEGACAEPIACFKNDKTITIRVKEVNIIIIAGTRLRTVIKRKMFTAFPKLSPSRLKLKPTSFGDTLTPSAKLSGAPIIKNNRNVANIAIFLCLYIRL